VPESPQNAAKNLPEKIDKLVFLIIIGKLSEALLKLPNPPYLHPLSLIRMEVS
jgi:hypothetical protein